MTQSDPRLPDLRAVRRAFGRAAKTYDAAALVHREVDGRMAERLEYVRLDVRRGLDAGCGTGSSISLLRRRCPGAALVGVDSALPMAREFRRRHAAPAGWLRSLLGPVAQPQGSGVSVACGDLAALPFPSGVFDLVWGNLALQWCVDPAAVFAEFLRVMRVGGLLMFSTLGPDTLTELRGAFARVDSYPHVLGFVDMHDLGDALLRAGFADPVMDMEQITVNYADLAALLRDLRATGARNAAAGRRRGLMGRRRWREFLENMEARRSADGLPVTYEVVYGHAWKPAPVRTPEGQAIVRFDRTPRS